MADAAVSVPITLVGKTELTPAEEDAIKEQIAEELGIDKDRVSLAVNPTPDGDAEVTATISNPPGETAVPPAAVDAAKDEIESRLESLDPPLTVEEIGNASETGIGQIVNDLGAALRRRVRWGFRHKRGFLRRKLARSLQPRLIYEFTEVAYELPDTAIFSSMWEGGKPGKSFFAVQGQPAASALNIL